MDYSEGVTKIRFDYSLLFIIVCVLYWTCLFNLILDFVWYTDTELRNIIDKLAQFVARNGPEFEQMTKNKQKDNPKFGFLFGGEHFNYYQYKVTTEQASKWHISR